MSGDSKEKSASLSKDGDKPKKGGNKEEGGEKHRRSGNRVSIGLALARIPTAKIAQMARDQEIKRSDGNTRIEMKNEAADLVSRIMHRIGPIAEDKHKGKVTMALVAADTEVHNPQLMETIFVRNKDYVEPPASNPDSEGDEIERFLRALKTKAAARAAPQRKASSKHRPKSKSASAAAAAAPADSSSGKDGNQSGQD